MKTPVLLYGEPYKFSGVGDIESEDPLFTNRYRFVTGQVREDTIDTTWHVVMFELDDRGALNLDAGSSQLAVGTIDLCLETIAELAEQDRSLYMMSGQSDVGVAAVLHHHGDLRAGAMSRVIGGNRVCVVVGDISTVRAGRDSSITVGASSVVTVAELASVAAGPGLTATVGWGTTVLSGSMTTVVGGDRCTIRTGSDSDITVGTISVVNAADRNKIAAGSGATIHAGDNTTLECGPRGYVTAGESLDAVVGDQSVVAAGRGAKIVGGRGSSFVVGAEATLEVRSGTTVRHAGSCEVKFRGRTYLFDVGPGERERGIRFGYTRITTFVC